MLHFLYFNGLILQLVLMVIDKLQKIIYSKSRKEQRGVIMKITIDYDSSINETEIHIKCNSMSEQIETFISELCLNDSKMVGYIDDEAFFVPLTEILYFEAVDSKVFFYTKENYYRCKSTLIILEENLKNTTFSRISKTSIANLKKLISIKKAENSKLLATLTNGEKIIVSRKYVDEIKRKLGV